MKATWREWLMVVAAAILGGLLITVGYLKFDKIDAGDIFQLLAALLGTILAVVGALYVESRKKDAEAAAETEPAIEALTQLEGVLQEAIAAPLNQKLHYEQKLSEAFDQVDQLRSFPPRRPRMKILLDEVANGRVLITAAQLRLKITAASNAHARPDELAEPNRSLNLYRDRTAKLIELYKGN